MSSTFTPPQPPVSSRPDVALHVCSYGAPGPSDRHEFVQLVLPLSGMLELEIAGRGGRADLLHGAVVAPGAWHAQHATGANRSLILDVDAAGFADGPWLRLLERPFTPLDAPARKLVEFMGLVTDAGAPVPATTLQAWAPLLLDTLAAGSPQPRSRLAALMARVEAAPGEPWSVEAMARAAGLSVSRLHALFRDRFDTSPRAWLQRTRLARACEWLAQSDRAVAAIALAAGFSDQSALTRAMRNTLDTTPSAYRRACREAGSKRQ